MPSAALPHWDVKTSEPGDASHTLLEAAATAAQVPCAQIWWWLWVSLVFQLFWGFFPVKY